MRFFVTGGALYKLNTRPLYLRMLIATSYKVLFLEFQGLTKKPMKRSSSNQLCIG